MPEEAQGLRETFMTPSDYIALGGLFAAQVIGVGIWIVGLGNRVTAVETKVDVFWKGVSFDAAAILHSPDPAHRELDELIEFYLQGLSNMEQLQQTVRLIEAKLRDVSQSKSERSAASLMLRSMHCRHPFLEVDETVFLPHGGV